jgi:hypothetical protein
MTLTFRRDAKAMLNSAKQVSWAAELSIDMLMLSQDRPILRRPLLWLHHLLLAYARWHYSRAHRIYARISDD